jgi:sec-independent protein translocase protein TatA
MLRAAEDRSDVEYGYEGASMTMFGDPLLLNILSGPDLIIVAIVALLFFGGKKIPDLAKGLGEGIKNFKHSVKEEEQPKPESKNT